MKRETQSSAPVVLLGIVIFVVALFASYVTGYFALGTRTTGIIGFYRVYESRWLAIIYGPATKVESVITGSEVRTGYTDPRYPYP
jgi:hypothetical protein